MNADNIFSIDISSPNISNSNKSSHIPTFHCPDLNKDDVFLPRMSYLGNSKYQEFCDTNFSMEEQEFSTLLNMDDASPLPTLYKHPMFNSEPDKPMHLDFQNITRDSKFTADSSHVKRNNP